MSGVFIQSLKDTSIKTRIETSGKIEITRALALSLKDTSIKTRIETMTNPVLVHNLILCLKDTSIKTRIETISEQRSEQEQDRV